jgi:hypothetical protein
VLAVMVIKGVLPHLVPPGPTSAAPGISPGHSRARASP